MRDGTQELFGRAIDVSSVDKLFFPGEGLTKGDLLDYYVRSAELVLAHADGRPLAFKRHPDGLAGHGFFQKNAGEHFPAWIHRQQVPKREGGELDHVVLDEPATVVYLADQGTIELHPWLATADDLEAPVELVLDLDPPDDGDPAAVRRAARLVRGVLDDLEVAARLKTSGSRGFHLHVPLDGSSEWDAARATARDLATLAAERHPDELTVAQRKDRRGGRVFVDWLRNAYGQTSVAAYSVRALPGAPVATPIEWDELGGTEPRRWTIGNLFRRLGQRDDPWATPLAPVAAATLRARLEALED
jgi:bifunctional non-homologous end joining protein LigD